MQRNKRFVEQSVMQEAYARGEGDHGEGGVPKRPPMLGEGAPGGEGSSTTQYGAETEKNKQRPATIVIKKHPGQSAPPR